MNLLIFVRESLVSTFIQPIKGPDFDFVFQTCFEGHTCVESNMCILEGVTINKPDNVAVFS